MIVNLLNFSFLEKMDQFCRHIKLMRENVFLNISYKNEECSKHDHEKVTVTYKFDKDKVDIDNEKKLFDQYFLRFELAKLCWKVSDQWSYITISEWIDFEDNFEFVIKRRTGNVQ